MVERCGGADNQDAPFIVVTQLPKTTNTTLKGYADQMLAKGKEYGWTDLETKSSSTRYMCVEERRGLMG